MSINKIEMQDDKGNTYYPHTDASIVKYGDSDVGTALAEITNDTGWIDLPLIGSAVTYVAATIPQYRKINKLVCVGGVMKGLTNINTGSSIIFANLPSGYRPSKQINVICQGSNADKWLLTINPTGDMKAGSYSNGSSFATTMTGTEYLAFNAEFMI